ncbi:MAG: hypothetical protein VX638_04875, partial [Chloroflexota bacterium]|nr:hypothetical protein [Chloroflexota bacterium]
ENGDCSRQYLETIGVDSCAAVNTALKSHGDVVELTIGKIHAGRPGLAGAPIMGNQNTVL